jgi:hypothetical protein
MQNQDITKFEFLLTLEKNIVIQRFFNVNNFNPESRNSLDLYECVTGICNEISRDLKTKTFDYMSETPNFYDDSKGVDDALDNKEEYFMLSIKLGEEVFISRRFPAHIFHPKVRYAVDIRPKVRKILAELTDVLSSKSQNKTYLQYNMK